MTREDLKKAFEMLEKGPNHQRQPVFYFSSKEENDAFFNDILEWVKEEQECRTTQETNTSTLPDPSSGSGR